jgi:hypothetical protein
MSPTYRIKDWQQHFENNRTRELKELRFVMVPNKHDGDGYTELLDHPNGTAHFGAWCAIVQVASKCEPRGTLVRKVGTIPQEGAGKSQEGATPHDAVSLSRLTRIPRSIFEEVLPRLMNIGWLEGELVDSRPNSVISQEVGTIPQEGAGKCDAYRIGSEGKGSDRKEEIKTPRHAERAGGTRGTRIPDDFEVSEKMRRWASDDARSVELKSATAEFIDYWQGVPGQRGLKLDWPATWRNRMRELEARNQRYAGKAYSVNAERNLGAQSAAPSEVSLAVQQVRAAVDLDGVPFDDALLAVDARIRDQVALRFSN